MNRCALFQDPEYQDSVCYDTGHIDIFIMFPALTIYNISCGFCIDCKRLLSRDIMNGPILIIVLCFVLSCFYAMSSFCIFIVV